MRISTRGRYGMNAIYELAINYNKSPVSLKVISDKRKIPLPYLEQLILQLKKEGIVGSKRGAKGGYVLIKSPKEVMISEILYILEGELAPVKCKDEQSCICCNNHNCPGEIIWEKINTAIVESLKDFSLQDWIISYDLKCKNREKTKQ